MVTEFEKKTVDFRKTWWFDNLNLIIYLTKRSSSWMQDDVSVKETYFRFLKL